MPGERRWGRTVELQSEIFHEIGGGSQRAMEAEEIEKRKKKALVMVCRRSGEGALVEWLNRGARWSKEEESLAWSRISRSKPVVERSISGGEGCQIGKLLGLAVAESRRPAAAPSSTPDLLLFLSRMSLSLLSNEREEARGGCMVLEKKLTG